MFSFQNLTHSYAIPFTMSSGLEEESIPSKSAKTEEPSKPVPKRSG